MTKKTKKPRKVVPLSPGTCIPFGDGGIQLTMIGKTEPQSRPRMLKSGRVISSASAELRAWRKSIGRAIREMDPPVVITGRTMIAIMVIGLPTNDDSRWGELSDVLPDVDNLGKAILDSLQDDRTIRAKLRKAEAAGGPAWVQEMPLEDDGRIAVLLVVKAHCPPPGFMRVRLEPAPSGRRSIAQAMLRLSQHLADPGLTAWPIDPD